MGTSRLVVIGLPSEELQALASGLGATVAACNEIARAHNAPDDVRTITPGKMMAEIATPLQADGQACALLVFQAPWNFLGRQLRLSRSAPQNEHHFEWFSRNALDFWNAYHACLLHLHRKYEKRCLLFNGGRGVGRDALSDLLRERFDCVTDGAAELPAARIANEEIWWQVVNLAAPDCLDLYSLLEGAAALAGRNPEFGSEVFPRRGARPFELARTELRVLSPASREQLYLQQIRQLEQELGRYVERERDHEKLVTPKLERRTRRLWASARQLLKRVTANPRAQAAAIRSSGLFDEQWYLHRYPDVARSGMDPVAHYLKFGVAEGRNPGPEFDTRRYLSTNDDVARSSMNPLLHYIEFGRREGRSPLGGRRLPTRAR